MANEIERKFLVDRIPSEIPLGPGTPLRQGYVAIDGNVEVRLRISEELSWLTVKAGRGLARTEVELVIPLDDAEALWPETGTRRIEKTRYRIAAADRVVDLDIFAGALDGLLTAEVEFTSEAAAASFVPPAWFGREVTGAPGWSNASLAVRGRPE